MPKYIKLSDRTKDQLSGYTKSGKKLIFDADKLQSFAKGNGWSAHYTLEVAHRLLHRIEQSPESVFDVY